MDDNHDTSNASVKPAMGEMLARFSTSPSAIELLGIVVDLTNLKNLHRAATDPAFLTGLRTLAAQASRGVEIERLSAVVALARTATLVRTQRQRVAELLQMALSEPIPSAASLPNPEDRRYVALACGLIDAPWVASYLADLAVGEETAEKPREVAVEGLSRHLGTVSKVLAELEQSLDRMPVRTEKPADTVGRRLRRILDAVAAECGRTSPLPGDRPGRALANLVDRAARRFGIPSDVRVKVEAAVAVADVVHQLVRSRFSQASISETYEGLEIVRAWFPGSSWEAVLVAPSMRRISEDLVEAISMLARAGVTDDRLMGVLAIAEGSPKAARAVTVRLAREVSGLPEAARDWLLGSSSRQKSMLAEESQLRAADEHIAALIVRLKATREATRRARLEQVPALAAKAPLDDQLLDLVDLIEGLLDNIQGLSESRALRLKGEVGAVVEFSSLEHELHGGHRSGVREVRIVEQAVEAVSTDGRSRIVRKALVEAV